MTAAAPATPTSSERIGSKTSLVRNSSSHTQPKPDPVADLVANADKEYQAGEDKFKAGDLEAAKRNFDHAVDMLLQSPAEIRVG